jgi:hypothetical protein
VILDPVVSDDGLAAVLTGNTDKRLIRGSDIDGFVRVVVAV